jgi:hypothetical protein
LITPKASWQNDVQTITSHFSEDLVSFNPVPIQPMAMNLFINNQQQKRTERRLGVQFFHLNGDKR